MTLGETLKGLASEIKTMNSGVRILSLRRQPQTLTRRTRAHRVQGCRICFDGAWRDHCQTHISFLGHIQMSHLVHLRIVGCAQDEKGLAVRQRKLVLLHLHSTLSEPRPNYPAPSSRCRLEQSLGKWCNSRRGPTCRVTFAFQDAQKGTEELDTRMLRQLHLFRRPSVCGVREFNRNDVGDSLTRVSCDSSYNVRGSPRYRSL